MTYADLRPDGIRLVHVLVDGRWRDGELEAYRRNLDGTWTGYVRWSTGPGEPNQLGWYAEHHLRALREREG